jgi:hypothetical protein
MKLILFDKVQKGFPVRACVRSDAFAPDQIDARSHLDAHLLSAKPFFCGLSWRAADRILSAFVWRGSLNNHNKIRKLHRICAVFIATDATEFRNTPLIPNFVFEDTATQPNKNAQLGRPALVGPTTHAPFLPALIRRSSIFLANFHICRCHARQFTERYSLVRIRLQRNLCRFIADGDPGDTNRFFACRSR